MRNGKMINIVGKDIAGEQKYCRAYSQDGRFLGMLCYVPDTGLWHPEKVFV